jgi:hypothetical protein
MDHLAAPPLPIADDQVPCGRIGAAQDVEAVPGEPRHVLAIAAVIVSGGSSQQLGDLHSPLAVAKDERLSLSPCLRVPPPDTWQAPDRPEHAAPPSSRIGHPRLPERA